jgi:hypothetical protein
MANVEPPILASKVGESPLCCIVIGMAGGGKTTFMDVRSLSCFLPMLLPTHILTFAVLTGNA